MLNAQAGRKKQAEVQIIKRSTVAARLADQIRVFRLEIRKEIEHRGTGQHD